MEETSASTQEVNATTQDVETAIISISDRAQEGANSASMVKDRADELKQMHCRQVTMQIIFIMMLRTN